MSKLLGEIDTHVEPGPYELSPVLGIPAVCDAEVQVILKLIGESHEEHRAVVGGQRGDPAAQGSDNRFVPDQGGVPRNQRFDLFTDRPSNVGALGGRNSSTPITKVAMGVGRMEKAGRDHGTRSPQQSENTCGPDRVGEEGLPRATEAAGEQPRREVVRCPDAFDIHLRIAALQELVVEPDVRLRRSEQRAGVSRGGSPSIWRGAASEPRSLAGYERGAG